MGRQGGAQFNTTPRHPKGKFRDQAFSIVTIVPGKAGSATVISLHLHITCIHYVYIAAPSEMATGATVARLKSLVEDSGICFFTLPLMSLLWILMLSQMEQLFASWDGHWDGFVYFPDGVIVEAPSFHLDLDSNGTGALASNVGDFYWLERRVESESYWYGQTNFSYILCAFDQQNVFCSFEREGGHYFYFNGTSSGKIPQRKLADFRAGHWTGANYASDDFASPISEGTYLDLKGDSTGTFLGQDLGHISARLLSYFETDLYWYGSTLFSKESYLTWPMLCVFETDHVFCKFNLQPDWGAFVFNGTSSTRVPMVV